MADSQAYNVVEALRSTLAGQFVTEKTRLDVSLAATPASSEFRLIQSDYDRARHQKFPAVFVLPFAQGTTAPIEYFTTQGRAAWMVPVLVTAVGREVKGLELTGIKTALEYAQILDACLVNNIRLGRSDTIVQTPESVQVLHFPEAPGGALWGCEIRLTLRIDVEYS